MFKKNPLALILGLSAFFFVVFLAVAVGTVMTLTPGKTQKRFFGKANSIGVLEVKGVIIDSKKLVEEIEEFEEDSFIKGVIVRVNSPGGSVAPSQEIYDALKRLQKKKPVYTSMGSVAASGGYYVACGTKKIFANAGTITGSIGVIMQFADVSKLMQWAKVSEYNIKTGKFKDIGSPTREMTEDEKQLLQGMIDNVLSQFRKAVSNARSIPMEKVIELSDGRIFSGEQAQSVKLVDEVGGFKDALDALVKETGISGKPHLVYAAKKRHGLERLFSGLDEEDEESSTSIGPNSLASSIEAILSLLRGESMRGAIQRPSRLLGPLFILPSAVQ